MNFGKCLSIGTVAALLVCSTACSITSSPKSEDSSEISSVSMSKAQIEFSNALSFRDVRKMFDAAMQEQKTDAVLAKKMLRKAGFYAALQQEKSLFAEISAIEPSCVEYKHYISKGKSASLLPQICAVKSISEVRNLKGDQLAKWDSYIAECYTQLSEEELNNIAAQVNDARRNMNAKELASAASSLAGKQIHGKIPSQLTPAGLLQEAILLAEINSDKKAMEECIKIAEEKNLISAREVKDAKQSLNAMSATRGRIRVSSDNGLETYHFSRNGVKYTRIVTSDGSKIDIANDSDDDDQKSRDVKRLLSNRLVNKRLNAICQRKGMKLRFHVPPKKREINLAVILFDELSEKSGLSFGDSVYAFLQVVQDGEL